MKQLDTGAACVFMNDGKNGPCNKVAIYILKKHALCSFHCAFMTSMDYFNEFGKPKKIEEDC